MPDASKPYLRPIRSSVSWNIGDVRPDMSTIPNPPDLPARNPHPLGNPRSTPLKVINAMIYIINITPKTAKSAIYVAYAGFEKPEHVAFWFVKILLPRIMSLNAIYGSARTLSMRNT